MPQTENALWKSVLPFAAVFAACAAFGYWVSSDKTPKSQPVTVQTNTGETATGPADQPAMVPTAVASKDQNADYDAPGAPRIEIKEEKNPVLSDNNASSKPLTDPNQPAKDSESSQIGTAAAPAIADQTANTVVSNGRDSKFIGSRPSSSPNDQTRPQDTSANAAAPSDPDFEKIINRDSESNQQATADASSTSTFRVQAGAFADSKNAKVLADALKSKGYSSMLREERAGDVTIYKVQAGVYKSKSAAAKAADELQRDGFPASVAPVK